MIHETGIKSPEYRGVYPGLIKDILPAPCAVVNEDSASSCNPDGGNA